jgi:hypothetical protein
MRLTVAFFREVRTPLNAETKAKENIAMIRIATMTIQIFRTFFMGVLSDFGA